MGYRGEENHEEVIFGLACSWQQLSLAFSPVASWAQNYDFTFTGGGVTATGVLNVESLGGWWCSMGFWVEPYTLTGSGHQRYRNHTGPIRFEYLFCHLRKYSDKQLNSCSFFNPAIYSDDGVFFQLHDRQFALFPTGSTYLDSDKGSTTRLTSYTGPEPAALTSVISGVTAPTITPSSRRETEAPQVQPWREIISSLTYVPEGGVALAVFAACWRGLFWCFASLTSHRLLRDSALSLILNSKVRPGLSLLGILFLKMKN